MRSTVAAIAEPLFAAPGERGSSGGTAGDPGPAPREPWRRALPARAPWEAVPWAEMTPVERLRFEAEAAEWDARAETWAAVASGVVDDGAAVAGIADLDGGADLAELLAGADVERLGAFDLLEVVAGYRRVAAWASARAAGAAAELARRPTMNPAWPEAAGTVRDACVAPTELSLRLGMTRQSAETLVTMGRVLDGVLAPTGELLEKGAIDWPKARVVADALHAVPVEVALAVQQVVLPRAPERTTTQLRRDLARALLEVDPQEAADRHRHAVRGRRVERPVVLPDGMAAVRAVLSAADAVRLDATLQGAAVAARADGDTRSVDQLRADALVAMGESAWATGWVGAGPGDATDADAARPGGMRVSRARAQVAVTVGLGALIGHDLAPAELAGYGPVGADVARGLAVDGVWRGVLVDGEGAVVGVGARRYRPGADVVEAVRVRDGTCVVPTCTVAAARCDIDHTVPHPRGETTPDNLGALCRRDHLAKTHAGFRLTQPSAGYFALRTPSGHVYWRTPARAPGTPWAAPPVEGSADPPPPF